MDVDRGRVYEIVVLISQAFQEYQSQMNLELPGDLWQKLVFESFVLALEEREI